MERKRAKDGSGAEPYAGLFWYIQVMESLDDRTTDEVIKAFKYGTEGVIICARFKAMISCAR